jgi:hypothetical protein
VTSAFSPNCTLDLGILESVANGAQMSATARKAVLELIVVKVRMDLNPFLAWQAVTLVLILGQSASVVLFPSVKPLNGGAAATKGHQIGHRC